jgi:hypothetical protein
VCQYNRPHNSNLQEQHAYAHICMHVVVCIHIPDARTYICTCMVPIPSVTGISFSFESVVVDALSLDLFFAAGTSRPPPSSTASSSPLTIVPSHAAIWPSDGGSNRTSGGGDQWQDSAAGCIVLNPGAPPAPPPPRFDTSSKRSSALYRKGVVYIMPFMHGTLYLVPCIFSRT